MEKKTTTNKKYKLTEEKKEIYTPSGKRVIYRIEALRDFGGVKKGERGGWIESEKNLSQSGECWVDDDAVVCEDARVEGNAWVVGGDTWVTENALVSGNAKVSGDAKVGGHAKVSGRTLVSGDVVVYGDALVEGIALVDGKDD